MAFSSSARSAVPMPADSSTSSSRQPSHQANFSFRASPSPSTTSQSDDQEQDDLDEEEDDDEEDDFTDVGSSQIHIKERRNTLKAKGSAALAVSALTSNSSEHWQIMPANARNASAATLPHEILLHIFKYVAPNPPDLRRALTVCKAWCLCGVELLWHRPSLNRIASLFKLIHVIRKPEQTSFPYASFVRRLSLSVLASDLEDSLFGHLSVCTRLERLTLTGCTSITDDKIATVLSQTKHLVAADFSEVTQLTDKSILAIAQNCPRLQGMNISGCKLITSDAVAALAKNCKLLRRMKLCGCELIGDSALTSLAQNCPVLLEVDLVNCPLITDSSVREMWKHSFHMRELRLAQCGMLTDLAFPAPTSSIGSSSGGSGGSGQTTALQQQHNFYGGSESAPASRGISPFYAQERSVSMTQGAVHSQSDDAVSRTSSIPTLPPMHTQLRSIRMFDHLRVLDLTNCSTISDAAIEGIVSNVPRIRNLILAKCTRLTNESVYSISRLGKNLHYLHLGHVSNLTDRAVCHLARSCTRLRYIDLACCPQLTDLSVLELAANLPKLRRIGLVRVTNLTDQAIYSLVERYVSLERIHLSYCENISVPAIYRLLERLPRLTHLSLTGVPSFRKQELQNMCREPPREFNQHQRTAFCVYSGKGVHELRKYLQVTSYGNDRHNSAAPGEAVSEAQRMRDNTTTSRGGGGAAAAAAAAGEQRRLHTRNIGHAEIAAAAAATRGLYHHQATRSEPSHSTVFTHASSLYGAPDMEPSRARLAPIGTSSRVPTSPSNNLASSSSSAQSNAMQVDERIGGWDSAQDEAMPAESESRSSSTAVPSKTHRAAVESNIASHPAFAFNSTPLRHDSSYSSAFVEPGRRLGGSTGPSGVVQSQTGITSVLAALATPPLNSSSSFFSMTAADQRTLFNSGSSSSINGTHLISSTPIQSISPQRRPPQAQQQPRHQHTPSTHPAPSDPSSPQSSTS